LKTLKGEEEGGLERTKEEREQDDTLRHIEIEVDLKRTENAQIMHLYSIGTWRGKRYVFFFFYSFRLCLGASWPLEGKEGIRFELN